MRARQVRISRPTRLLAGVFKLVGSTIRGTAVAIGVLVDWLWYPALALAVVHFIGAPALLWERRYVELGEEQIDVHCTYLAIDGIHRFEKIGSCYYVTLLPLRIQDFWKLRED